MIRHAVSEEVISKKVSHYSKERKPIHIKLKTGEFRNGYVTYIGAEFFEIEEFKLGSQTIFFLEVWDVVAFTNPTNDE